jgi:hypothetical protein
MKPSETERFHRLATALEANVGNVVPHPVEQIGGYPQTVIYPGDPLAQAGEDCDLELSVHVVVYLARANNIETVDMALDTIGPVRSSCYAADAVWHSMTYQPIDLGGMTHLAAVHDVTIQ